MSPHGKYAGILTVIACTALAACARSPEPTRGDVASDTAELRQILDGITDTFNKGELDAMLAFYTDDLIVFAPDAPDIVGKQAWRDGLARIPPNIAMHMRFDTKELEVSGDLAYESGLFTVEATDKATGAKLPTTTRRYVHIFKRQLDGHWKGWRLMENSSEPTPAPAPAG